MQLLAFVGWPQSLLLTLLILDSFWAYGGERKQLESLLPGSFFGPFEKKGIGGFLMGLKKK